MKRTLSTIAFVLLVSGSFAQGIVGDWSGTLNFRGTVLHIIFHISQNADIYKTTMDSPDQGAKNLPTGKTTVTGNQVAIDASQYGIKYTGTYVPDSNKLNGSFPQGGANIPLVLTWSKSVIVTRPQDPKSFPYKREEITFDDLKGGDKLAGTLTMPADGKASKIVVLITGSGAQNRDEELLNHRPFLVWSDWLTRHGIAVLRYDDRGTAQSTGNYNTATTADFANDAEAAVSYIQSRPDLKNLSIGLMGHSEGGTIAPMVASRNKAVKFLVLLAGPGVPSTDLMVKQTNDVMVGAPPALIQHYTNRNKKLYELVVKNPGATNQQLYAEITKYMFQDAREHPAEGLDSAKTMQAVNALSAFLLTPWTRYFLTIDPSVYLTKIKCPVLALDGTKDLQVNADANLAGIKASLEKAGNKHYEIVKLDGLNHLFQKANTGAVAEYEQIEETVDPVALEKVSQWIGQL